MSALLLLLPVSDRDKEVEILALRHQIMVLERRLGKARPRFSVAGSRVRFLIRDGDGKYPDLSGAVLKDAAGITVVLSGVQMQRMNAVMERWVLTCRRELPAGP